MTKLGDPCFTVYRDAHVPDAVPVPVHGKPVVRDLHVAFCPRRVRPEKEAGTLVLQCVQRDAESIVFRPVEVFIKLRDPEVVHIGFIADRSDIQVVVVIQEQNFGRFGRRLTRPWFPLNELARRGRRLPHGLIQSAINDDFLVCADGLGDSRKTNGVVVNRGDDDSGRVVVSLELRQSRGRCQQEAGQQEKTVTHKTLE